MYRMNQEQKQRSSLLFFSLLFLLLHHHQKVGSQRVKPSSRGQGELEKNALKLYPRMFSLQIQAAVFIRVRSPKNMPLKCMRSQVCTPLQIVAGCCCWLLLLLLAAAGCCCCCCWLLLLLLLAAAGCCCCCCLAAAGCCCWLLRLLLAAAAAAAAGCCCCWLLLQLIAGICRNKENNANCKCATPDPRHLRLARDLRATCAKI